MMLAGGGWRARRRTDWDAMLRGEGMPPEPRTTIRPTEALVVRACIATAVQDELGAHLARVRREVEVLAMFLDGLSEAKIGAALGLPRTSVQRVLERAKEAAKWKRRPKRCSGCVQRRRGYP